MALPLFQNRETSTSSRNDHYFGHYAFESQSTSTSSLRVGKKSTILSNDIACSMKLFNGETMYSGKQIPVLKSMLSCAKECTSSGTFTETKASGEPETLVSGRRKDA
eukprot:66524_1